VHTVQSCNGSNNNNVNDNGIIVGNGDIVIIKSIGALITITSIGLFFHVYSIDV
jgi:hypothetical protein